MFDSFVERFHTVGLLAPVDLVATAQNSKWLHLVEAHKVNLFVFFGAITSASADQVPTVTVQCSSTNASGAEVAVAFNYRASGAVGTDSWGSKVAATSAGFQPATTDDNKMYAITIDPAELFTTKSDAQWIRVVVTPNGGSSSLLAGVWAQYESRYGSNSQNSAS